jgi:hypothetical protein
MEKEQYQDIILNALVIASLVEELQKKGMTIEEIIEIKYNNSKSKNK